MTDDELFENAKWVAAVVVVAGLGVLGLYFLNSLLGKPLGESADLGQFGDFIGGLVNPIVGLGTVILVVFSIAMQRRELKASVVEMKGANEATKLQNLESSLFAWLNTYHDLIGALRHDDAAGRWVMVRWHHWGFSGQAVLSNSTFTKSPEDLQEFTPPMQVLFAAGVEALKECEVVTAQGWVAMVEAIDRSCRRFDQLYADQRWQLDAVFRTLYRLLHWIDQSDLANDRKWHYVALVRAQLSWIEMIFIFYDSLSPEGRKLAHLANKYALLDNLAPETDEMVRVYVERLKLTSPAHDEELPKPERAALTISAFSSAAARSALGLTSAA